MEGTPISTMSGPAVSRPDSSPIGPVAPERREGSGTAGKASGQAPGFADVLNRALEAGNPARAAGEAGFASGSLRLSRHAAQRLHEAGLTYGSAEARVLEEAVGRVAARGGRECLAMTSRAAYVVHIPSGTVVTAITGQRMKEGVFTGIDSAVFVREAGLDGQAGAPAPWIDGDGATAREVAGQDRVTGRGTLQMKEAVAP